MFESDEKFFLLGPEYFKNLLSFQDGEGFVKALIVGLMAGATYVFPTKDLQDTAVAASVLVVLDTLTGITAVFVEKKPRTSAGFARVLAKAFAYLSVCAVAAIVEKTIFKGSGLSISMGVLWLVIATEGISVIENVERISGGRFRWLRAILGKVLDDDKEAARKEKEKDV